ncbi:hypothetical protein OPIT5_29770 [Opitutaceae bacterium TAV5]|nr:hypothetical protein OPIT5_29770 [Opitutaceae bacterium TAV5]
MLKRIRISFAAILVSSTFALVSSTLFAADAVVFEPSFTGNKVGYPDWLTAYTHMKDRMAITAGPAENAAGAPPGNVAAFVLGETATSADRGKASYIRSRAIRVGEGRFSVAWSADIQAGVYNPSMELWGRVGSRANDYKALLLRLEFPSSGEVRHGKTVLGKAAPGWRHFKIEVNTATRTFDYYCDDIDTPVARDQPLRSSTSENVDDMPDWNRTGIGFFLAVSPGTSPARWQIGGIRVATASPSVPAPPAGARVSALWRPERPQARLIVLESATTADTAAFYDLLASAATTPAASRTSLEIVPYTLPSPSADRRPASRQPPTAAETLIAERSSSDIARELGIPEAKLPALVLTSSRQEILALWTSPFDTATAKTILVALNDPAPQGANVLPLAPFVIPSTASVPAASSAAPPGEPLGGPARDTPAHWLTLGTWAGPAGLSLWGLDYEAQVRPVPGAPQIVTYWDSAWYARWTPHQPGAADDHRILIETLSRDYAWAKGAAYAHLYVHTPNPVEIALRISQTGSRISGWLNGRSLDWKRDSTVASGNDEIEETGRNDQGGTVVIRRIRGDTAHVAALKLDAGWNRLLVKLVMQQRKGENFAFTARFSGSQASLADIRTTISDPSPAQISRDVASRFIPRVYTSAPFNLVSPGAPLAIDVDLASGDLLGQTIEPFPRQPAGRLELILTDYDGKEILRRTRSFTLPGRTTFDLGSAPVSSGYYATHLRIFDTDGNPVHSYPPDGFSVIRGTAAQRERKDAKKMSVTYYFMAGQERYRTLFFPYMERIGILRNIGGHNGRAPDFYQQARDRGLDVIADTWTHRDPDYLRAYVKETTPLVTTWKAFNEVDIHPAQRGTPAAWVAKAKQDYEIIKKQNPSAFMIGASLVRPASDSWFEACLKLGLADYHDAWDVHCYPQKPPVLEGSMSNSPNETELGVLKVYKKLGLKNTRPFWIGETGARSGHGHDARRWQAATIAKIAACVLSRDDFQKVGFLVPWRYSRGENRYYISDIENGHMPAEAALYTASALIDGFDYKRVVTEKTIQAARFGPTLMVWSTDTTRPATLKYRPGEKGPFVLVDVVGRVTDLSADAFAPDGTLTLALTDSPVYLLTRDNYERLTRF